MCMKRVQHLLLEEHIEFLDEHTEQDRSEHIRRAVGDYIAKLKRIDQTVTPVKSASKVFKKGEVYGDNTSQSGS